MHHSSTSTYIPNFTEIEQTFCGRTDGHLRPTVLGREHLVAASLDDIAVFTWLKLKALLPRRRDLTELEWYCNYKFCQLDHTRCTHPHVLSHCLQTALHGMEASEPVQRRRRPVEHSPSLRAAQAQHTSSQQALSDDTAVKYNTHHLSKHWVTTQTVSNCTQTKLQG